MRLQRLLARAGVTSRRKAEAVIAAGRVQVDGRTAVLGESVDPVRQRVTVDGRRIVETAPVWLALHKPVGCAVSRGDAHGRPTIFALVPAIPGLVYVGRLDIMTSGLLLLTTDGEGAHRLTHPRFGVPRTYRVRVRGRLGARQLTERLARPVSVGGRPVEVMRTRARTRGDATEVELTLAEGRNRIVRRLCAALGLTVEALHRISYGPIRLGKLASGRYRALTAVERQALERSWISATQPS